VKVQVLKAATENEIDSVFASLVRLQVGALVQGADPAGLPVDVFLVGGEASIRAAMQATDQIPIIKFDFNPPVAVPTPTLPTAGAGIAESGLPKAPARWAEWFGVAGGKMQLTVCKAPMQPVSCLPAIRQCHNVAGRIWASCRVGTAFAAFIQTISDRVHGLHIGRRCRGGRIL
jgi:hypothetical protein